ncbi:MAG: triose-phosphate isomerase [Peptococcaceae bacterium]|nr:triose-phosphate isomerase [Peptococcaceae bacterium]
MKRRPLFVANWKMNKTMADTKNFLDVFNTYVLPEASDVAICAPFMDLTVLRDQNKVAVGAEDVYPAEKGAFTGEISAEMLKECNVKYVIVGHSERRQVLGESDAFVAEKYHYCTENGLVPILCVGETLEQREAGEAENWCKGQLDAVFEEAKALPEEIVVAYEPIWAIGTGKTATADDAQQMLAALRAHLAGLIGEDKAASARLLYGGSAKASNIRELMAQSDIDGGLIGGASLETESFFALINEGSADID